MTMMFFLKPCYAPLKAEMPPPRAKTKKAKRKYFNKELVELRKRQKQERESILTLILNWFIDDE